MALKQVTSEPFAYLQECTIADVQPTAGTIIYEFEESVSLHGLSIAPGTETITANVYVSFPRSFSTNQEGADVVLYTGQIGPEGFFMAPGAISTNPTGPTSASAPLPHVLPKGGTIKVTAVYGSGQTDLQVFLIASSMGMSHHHRY